MADTKISALTAETTPLDADVLPIVDTANTTTKKVSWANTKATLKTYLDTLYLTASNSATLTNKVLSDSTSYLGNVSDVTKALIFSLGGATTAKTMTITSSHTNNRTLTLPDTTDTLVGKATTDTLTNKTLTTPTITKPVMSATNPTAQTYTPSAAATATLDLSLSNQHDITMPAGNITIALSNDTNNQIFMVSVTQDSVGSRTVTWFTTIKWAGGSAPTLTTTANKADTFGFKRTGSGTYNGHVVGQNI